MLRIMNRVMALSSTLALLTSSAFAGETQALIDQAVSAATCMPNTMPDDHAPMCNDALWMKMMHAVGNKLPFEADGIGISYMLQGDIGAGVSNATPYHPDPKNADDYTEGGPHLMIIVPKAMLKGMTTDPASGGPYVMWADTPYAHIMVPVTDVE